MYARFTASLLVITTLLSGPSFAQTQANKKSPSLTSGEVKGGPSSLVILFELGSAKIRPADTHILDQASRTFNEGKPIVMIISGSSDRSGNPKQNLALSEQRATTVLHALLDRGLPAERFQVLAKGETDPSIPTPPGVAERENRRVVITWH